MMEREISMAAISGFAQKFKAGQQNRVAMNAAVKNGIDAAAEISPLSEKRGMSFQSRWRREKSQTRKPLADAGCSRL